MNTPIVDFVRNYTNSGTVRLHMPGHKGDSLLGFENADITEINGADVLYASDGIIAESEKNAAALFGAQRTLYSAEGSSLAIKAMLAQVKKKHPENCRILAARNVHKSFIFGCALLGIEVDFIYPASRSHLASAVITPVELEEQIKTASAPPDAVFITSPDYLGKISDIKGIAAVCKKHRVPLLVDNAHGAYLAFLESSRHPIALGADMCADSAHKTLPSLTGGAYLHISTSADPDLYDGIEDSMAMFASSSPSYLILQSLDLTNKYISDSYPKKLTSCIGRVRQLKEDLANSGFKIEDGEELKLTIDANSVGYSGTELAAHLRANAIELEFSDSKYCVAMFTPNNSQSDYDRILSALLTLEKKSPIDNGGLSIPRAKVGMPMRKAMFSRQKNIPVREAEGKICAAPTVSCPPAVPIAVTGEIISREAIELMLACGITTVSVVSE